MKYLLLPLTIWLALAGPLGANNNNGAIQCANLIYGGVHTSRCFSDEFLSAVQRETTIATERRFRSVKLDSDELFNYPFAMMTGEADFMLSTREREHLKRYLENGGFLLASSGCSSQNWTQAFRREITAIFGDDALQRIPLDHALFHTVRVIDSIELTHPADPPYLEGMEMDGKLVVVFSANGLNNTEYTEGCCCCGANEIKNAQELNMNILVYALMH